MSRMADRIAWYGRLQVLCALSSALLCCLQFASALSDDDVPVFTEEPLSVVQKLGGSVTLRCSARPAQAHISWRLNGRELFVSGDEVELGVVMQSDALFIPSLSNVTLGRYQCVASTRAGARASTPANVTAANSHFLKHKK